MTKVLVIEDERAQAAFVATVLRQNGYEVFTAENGERGVEMSEKHVPDLIVSDIHMDAMDGFEALANIRKSPATATVPFIFITAAPDRDAMRHGMDLGADDFLPKPFSAAELMSAVSTRLQKHRLLFQRADKQLKELRATMSVTLPHELRTPLNGILGYADLLRKQHEDLQPAEVSKMAERIYKNGKRLQRLVENYILFAQLELKQTKLHTDEDVPEFRTKNVDKLINHLALQKAEEFNRSADLTLTLHDAVIAISSEYFAKMVEEILDNAFKFSKPGTQVQVQTETKDIGFQLSVSDRGRGLTPQQVKEMGAFVQFERKFYEQQGSGLGLMVVTGLAKLHGGSLKIESEYGHSTTVSLVLPQALGD